MSHSPIKHYVILVSEHNIAEYQACLSFQPEHIHLIITTRMQKAAQRLQKTLENSSLSSKIHLIPSDHHYPLSGESALEISKWIEHVFQPYTEQWQAQDFCVLNMTGATKILSTLLLYAYPWQKIHYQPFLPQQAQLQVEQLYIHPTNNHLVFSERTALNSEIDLLNALRLYADQVKSHTPNPIFQRPESIDLALQRFEAQKENSDHPFTAITPVLQQLWFVDKPNQKTVFKSWQDFQYATPTRLHKFFKQLYQLDENATTLRCDEQGVELPTIQYKKMQNWRKWISGDWFEQLIYHWLIQQGVASQRLRQGVQISSAQASGNETDILLLKNNQLHFLEIKSDISKQQSLKEFEGQLLAQSDQLGKVNKVLVVSDSIKRSKSTEQWLAFENNCQSKQIRIIVISKAEDLDVLI
ncbi:hypothetical protein RFI02_11975 [Acinetobacter sichuanensis]|uniref:hypothetical protein n=1 Tax=Acinetobacter sichuanensis TaxID=2136183 RepID=UPI00280F20C2|nr:hypothetical protein [Acinetobacter sichuanensis]MDQ9021823.1 hypothetical protein [Acinetobacter sichuanensis]